MNVGNDLGNKQTMTGRNDKIKDLTKRIADADDEVDADEYEEE